MIKPAPVVREAQSHPWHIASRRYSLAVALILVFATFIALAIFNSFVFDLAGWGTAPWVVLPAVIVQLGGAIIVLARRDLVHLDLDLDELLGFAAIVLITTLYLIYPSLPALLPPSHHYDSVHPIVLADFIFENHALPHDFTGATKPYFPPGYPVGGALVVALLSDWLGQEPIHTLHPFISVILGMTAGLAFCFARRLLRGREFSTAVAFFATMLLFTAWEYFPGSVNERYFFGQTFAQFFALLVFYLLIDYRDEPDLLSVALLLMGMATVLFSHPTPMAAPTFATGILIIFNATRNMKQSVIHATLIALGLGLVVVTYVLPRLNAWIGQTGYGEAAPVSIESLGLVLPLLACVGIILSMRYRWWGQAWIAFLFLGAVLAQPVSLLVGRFFIQGIGTYYFEKSAYLLIYALLLFAALALAWLIDQLRNRVPPARLAFFVRTSSMICVPVIISLLPPRPFAPLTLNELEVAEWAKTHLNVNNLAVVSDIREDAYWTQVAVFEQAPSTLSAAGAYNLGSMTFPEWRGNPGEPDYAIVRNLSHVPKDTTTQIIVQIGESGILRKPPAAPFISVSPQFNTDDQFGDLFTLVGYDTLETWSPGSTPSITFYWQPTRWHPNRLSMFVQILDSSGDVVARAENEMFQGKFPTQRWPIGSVSSDTWQLKLDANTAAGDYMIQVAVFDKLTGTRLPVKSSNPEHADEVRLGPVRVAIPPPSAEELGAARSVNAHFGRSIELRGYTIEPQLVRGGESLRAVLYWASVAPEPSNYTVFVHLLDSTGNVRAQVDSLPQNGTRPTNTWQPNEIIKDSYRLTLPKDLAPGEYRVEVGLYDPASSKRVLVEGGDQVYLPETITVR